MDHNDTLTDLLDALTTDIGLRPGDREAATWLRPLNDHLSLWLGGEKIEFAQHEITGRNHQALRAGQPAYAAIEGVRVFVLTARYAMHLALTPNPEFDDEPVIKESHLVDRSKIASLSVTPPSRWVGDVHGLHIDVRFDDMPATIAIPPHGKRDHGAAAPTRLVQGLRTDYLSRFSALQTWPVASIDD